MRLNNYIKKENSSGEAGKMFMFAERSKYKNKDMYNQYFFMGYSGSWNYAV